MPASGRTRTEVDSAIWAQISEIIIDNCFHFRVGDPTRALSYLNNACTHAPTSDASAFVLRSQCLIRLGKYTEADADADFILEISPHNLRGILCKAEVQYNMGRFEHALMHFHRARVVRKDYPGVTEGLSKATDAIQNSLSGTRGFKFDDLKGSIMLLVEEGKKEEERQLNENLKRMGEKTTT